MWFAMNGSDDGRDDAADGHVPWPCIMLSASNANSI